MEELKSAGEYNGIKWPELVSGVLIKRYKRFITDVRINGDKIVNAHCPNTGSMKGCCEPGRPVYLSVHDNPKRKLKYTWELIDMPTSLVGVNTLMPNRLVFESIKAGLIAELRHYDTIEREVKISDHSRIDLVLKSRDQKTCYVEIKNCTLVEGDAALFPDAVTSRGRKHIGELVNLVNSGNRCVMFYFIQRTDAHVFKPADQIDPEYGKALRHAVNQGVEILVYDVDINLTGIKLNRKIPCEL